MINKALVTVCIVTYNQKKYIRKCLDSIVNQKTNYQFQVLISDDASTDGTSEICAEYENKYSFIKYVRHSKNIGALENFKYVHCNVNSIFVAHCDADDYWDNNKLESQVSYLLENIDCSAVYSNATVINEDGSAFGLFNNSEAIPEKINSGFLLQKYNFLNNSSMMYRASAIGTTFSASEMVVDYHVHINLSNRGFLGYIKTPLAFYRKGAEGSICLTIPTIVGDLVHKARVDGVKQSKLNVDEFSKIKANSWYGKITAWLRKNQFAYNRHSEISELISDYSYILSAKYFLSELLTLLANKFKDKLLFSKVNVFCRR